MTTAFALVLLVGVLGFAVVRPRRMPEAVGAVPAAGIAVATGLVPWHAAVEEVRALAPTAGSSRVLLLAHLADRAGVFRRRAWTPRASSATRCRCCT